MGASFAYDQAGEQAPDEMKVSVDGSPLRLSSLPFSVGQVLDYFTEAFGRGPFTIEGKSFVYKDRENPDEVAIIIVSDLGVGLSVVLLATGGYGVNYIREFFEAPFFLSEETEQLSKLLDSGSNEHYRCGKLDRRGDRVQLAATVPASFALATSRAG